MNLYVKARTGFNEPVYKDFTVTQLECNLQSLTLNSGIRPLIVATPSEHTSFSSTSETVTSLYVNSEPKKCYEIDYTFLDQDKNELPADLLAKLSIVGNKIFFDQQNYDKKVHHLNLRI